MPDNRQLINVRTWKRFNQLLTTTLPVGTVEQVLNQLSPAWLDIAHAESVVVSILRHDDKSLLVARADRVGTSFREVDAAGDIWDELAVLEIADDVAGSGTVSRYETIPLVGKGQFEGGVILEVRESRALDTSAVQELTHLTQKLLEQAIEISLIPQSPVRPQAVVITEPRRDDKHVPLAEPIERQTSRSKPPVVSGIPVAEFEERLLRAKMEAMAEFAAGAGHEINNPIASIAGRVELLMRSETNPERRQSLAAIGGQAYRVRDMIGDAMLFGRPPKPNPVSCSLNEAIEEVVEKLQATERGQQCRFSLELASGVVVHADPTQLRIVISSLINNSLESIQSNGTIRIHSNVTEGDRGNRIGKFEITDNGVGLEAKDREFLFDPFYSGRQAGRGLGFGLPKSWRIIDQHNGQIEFDSRPGGPTTFTVLWPATESRSLRRDEQLSAPVRPKRPKATRGAARDTARDTIPEAIAEELVDERLEDTGYKIPRRRRKRSF